MNDYCVDLNLPMPLSESISDVVSFLKQYNKRHFQISKELISDELKTLFAEYNLGIRLVEIFYRSPDAVGNIHSDMKVIGDYSKLNWIYGGEGSSMNWYKINETYIGNTTTHTTDINSYALYYKDTEVDLLHSQSVGNPSLVQVGIPHNVINSDTDRFCISVVFEDMDTKQRPTFAEALDLFKNYIK
jgi:hypothetical protein